MKFFFSHTQGRFAVYVRGAGVCFWLTDDNVLVLFVFLGPWLSP